MKARVFVDSATAEVRALEARRDGRLLNVSLTIEGETE